MFIRYGILVVAVNVFCGLFLVDLEARIDQSYVLRFTSQPRSVVAAEGQNASITCTAVSTVDPVTYQWLVNESTLLLSSNKNHFTFNSVTITNLQRHTDNGVYRCIASNGIGSVLSNKATIQVAYFDVLDTNQSITYEVKLFQSKILPAPIVHSVPPAQYVWRQKGNIIEDGYSGKIFISPNGDLTVVAPSDRQSGYDFVCIVQNPITKQEFRKQYSLKIKGRFNTERETSFLKTPTDKVIDAGMPRVVFECIADVVLMKRGNMIGFRPPSIRWYKDSEAISVDGSSKYGYLKNTTALNKKLIVYKPEKDDEGEYYCCATGLNETIKSPNATLTVRDPSPKFLTQLTPIITTWPGKRVKIKCPYLNDGEDPEEDVDEDEDDNTVCMWYKNAKQLVLDGRRMIVKDRNLIIINANSSDSGLYQVLVRNDGGEIIGNATYLRVKGNDSSSIQPTQSTTPASGVYSSSISILSFGTQTVLSETTDLTYTLKPTLTLTSATPRQASLTPTPSLLPASSSPPTSSSPLPLSSSPSPPPPSPPPPSSSSSPSPPPPSSSSSSTTKGLHTSTPLQTSTETSSTANSIPTTTDKPSPPVSTYKTFSPNVTITLSKASTITQTTTTYNQTGGGDTTERSTTKITKDVDSRKKSVNDGQKGLLIWISAGVGGFVILSVAIVTIVYCCAKGNRPRKQSFKLKQEEYELEMNSLPRRNQGAGKGLSVIEKTLPRSIPGVDKARLLTDDDEVLYAPVTALDNIAADFENDHSPAQGPVYAEPIKNTKRKPYKKPLPSTPDPKHNKYIERPDSIHSYLELLGPDEVPSNLYAEPREGELNDFVKNAVKPNECIYDCAREGVLTNTLRRIMKQEGHGEKNINAPLYHVLESQPIETGHGKRESSLYASPEDILPGVSQPSSNERRSYSEPLYHVLEPHSNFSADNKEDSDNIYEYYKADDTIKRESVYQPLVNYIKNGNDANSSNVYQALDGKARSPSAPSSGHQITDGKSNRDSRSLTDPNRFSGYSDDSEDLYQPLNDSERCPLDVSKPRASFSKLRHPKRDSFLSMGETSSSPSTSLKSYHEPTLHAVAVSPAGTLKEPKKFRPGHRRNRSDTHIVVNIANLNQRRGSVQVPVLSSTNEEQSKFRHKRNHSDAGLCPVNLSQLRVSIDLDSPSQGDDSNGLYMPLMKRGIDQENKENICQNKSI